MANIPQELKYTKDHEWVRVSGNRAVVGITEHASNQLGDVVYVELPKVGASFDAEGSLGTVESTKAVSDIYSPVSGKVVKVNDTLTASPELINSDPYGEGWIVELELSNTQQLAGLMDAAHYEKHTQEQ